MPRTTPKLVQAALGANYGKLPDGTLPDLAQWIAMASVMCDQAAACAVAKGLPLLGRQNASQFVPDPDAPVDKDTQLELMERNLAGHYYTKMDPVYASKNTGKSTATFVRGQTEPEPYKDIAITLDTSGCLNALLNRKSAGGFWLGKTVSEQVPYTDRR